MNAPPITESARGNGQATTGRNTQDTPRDSTNGRDFKPSVFETGGTPHTLGDIRHALEVKCAACWAIGQMVPIDLKRVRNPYLARLVGAAQLFARSEKPWSVRDLLECTGSLEGPGLTVAMAAQDRPRWSNTDYAILEAVERMEQLQRMEAA